MGRVAGLAAGSAVVLATLFVGSGTAVAAPAGPAVSGAVGTQQGSGCSDAAASTGAGGSDSATAAGPLEMLCQLITGSGAGASGDTSGGASGGTGGVAVSSGSSGSGSSSSAATGGGTAATGTSGTAASATAPAPGAAGAAAPPPGGGVLSSILAFLAGCLQAVGL